MCYGRRVKTIAQRELRNESGAILRAAEAGETFTITVDGRPVATLGPHRRREWLPADSLADFFATPTDEALLEDVRVLDDAPEDPWEPR